MPLISLLIIILNAGRIVDFATDRFWTIVANQLEKEAAEHEEKIARGEIVRGKDTVIIWENKYVIYHMDYGKSLFLHNGDTEEMILKGIKNKYGGLINAKIFNVFHHSCCVCLHNVQRIGRQRNVI